MEKDAEKARAYFERAAEAGHLKTARFLGFNLEKGKEPFPQDLAKSFHFYKIASELGDLYSRVKLAIAYFQGQHLENPFFLQFH